MVRNPCWSVFLQPWSILSRQVAVKTSEKLIERLVRDGFIPSDSNPEFQRLYPGYWQRSGGAWSWMVKYSGACEIGSQYPVSELLKAVEIVASDNSRFYEVSPKQVVK